MAYKPPKTAKGLLRRYANGEREFHNAKLVGAEFIGADLSNANLRHADLSGANLSGANLSDADLRNANLSNADLSNANLRHADLSGANLSGADLNSASLSEADLRNANLSNANLNDADLRRANLRNAKLCYANLSDAKLSAADLGKADLTSADLHGADLSDADLYAANLSKADLIDASFGDASLFETDLSGASLGNADLSGANLIDAKLVGAKLRCANLLGTRLHNVDLSGADFFGTELNSTVLGRVSLIEICKAEPSILHSGPSIIDFESITMSLLAPNLEQFLIRSGIPAIAAPYMIESAKAVKGSVWNMMQSVFISYGSPDEAFARKLYEALHSNGVRTFFFAEHAEPGEKLHRMMRKGVNEHERIVLICSKASLDRKGVLNEIEESLTREAREGGEAYLIPIRLDDYVFSGWKPARADVAQAVRDRVVADFEGTMTDQAKFDATLLKLLRPLRVKNPAPTSP